MRSTLLYFFGSHIESLRAIHTTLVGNTVNVKIEGVCETMAPLLRPLLDPLLEVVHSDLGIRVVLESFSCGLLPPPSAPPPPRAPPSPLPPPLPSPQCPPVPAMPPHPPPLPPHSPVILSPPIFPPLPPGWDVDTWPALPPGPSQLSQGLASAKNEENSSLLLLAVTLGILSLFLLILVLHCRRQCSKKELVDQSTRRSSIRIHDEIESGADGEAVHFPALTLKKWARNSMSNEEATGKHVKWLPASPRRTRVQPVAPAKRKVQLNSADVQLQPVNTRSEGIVKHLSEAKLGASGDVKPSLLARMASGKLGSNKDLNSQLGHPTLNSQRSGLGSSGKLSKQRSENCLPITSQRSAGKNRGDEQAPQLTSAGSSFSLVQKQDLLSTRI